MCGIWGIGDMLPIVGIAVIGIIPGIGKRPG